MRNISNFDRKFNNQIRNFSFSGMNNSKFIRLFGRLSENSEVVKRCLIKDIWDEQLREIKIPKKEYFSTVFDERGIKDGKYGPYQFKEIEQIIFPKIWTIERQMRLQKLEAFKFEQDIETIKEIIEEIGELEIEFNNESLMIYAYRQ